MSSGHGMLSILFAGSWPASQHHRRWESIIDHQLIQVAPLMGMQEHPLVKLSGLVKVRKHLVSQGHYTHR